MAAQAAAILVYTERRCSTALDGEQHAHVQPTEPGSVPFYETLAMQANDVGHLERWRVHFLCNFRERLTSSGLETSSLSNGEPAARICRSDRCR